MLWPKDTFTIHGDRGARMARMGTKLDRISELSTQKTQMDFTSLYHLRCSLKLYIHTSDNSQILE